MLSVPLSPKVNWCTNKRGVKDPSTNTCQYSWDGKAWDCKHKKWALQTVLGSRVQSVLEVTFLQNWFCPNTILADLTEWSVYRKPPIKDKGVSVGDMKWSNSLRFCTTVCFVK